MKIMIQKSLRIWGYLFLLSVLFMACSPKVEDRSYLTTGRKNFDAGATKLQNKNYQAAVEEFQAAIQYNDQQPEYFVNLGYAQYQLKLFEQSRDNFLEAIRLDPKNKEAWYNLALSYQALGEKTSAVRAFQKYERLLSP